MTIPYLMFNQNNPQSTLHILSALLMAPGAVNVNLEDQDIESLKTELKYLCDEYTVPSDELGMVDGVRFLGLPVTLGGTKELLTELCELVKLVAEPRIRHRGDTVSTCQLRCILNNIGEVMMAVDGLQAEDWVPDPQFPRSAHYLYAR